MDGSAPSLEHRLRSGVEEFLRSHNANENEISRIKLFGHCSRAEVPNEVHPATPGLNRQEILPQEQSYGEAKNQTAEHRYNPANTHVPWFHVDQNYSHGKYPSMKASSRYLGE